MDQYEEPGEGERVRVMAYQLWEARGCPFGSPETDWYQAEAEVRAERERPESDAKLVALAKAIGSVVGAVADMVSGVTGKPLK